MHHEGKQIKLCTKLTFAFLVFFAVAVTTSLQQRLSSFFMYEYQVNVLSACLRRPDVSLLLAPSFVRGTEGMLKFHSFDKPPDTTLFSSYYCCYCLCSNFTVFTGCFFSLLPAFFSLVYFGSSSRFCSPVRASHPFFCLLYTSPSPRDLSTSRMPSSA